MATTHRCPLHAGGEPQLDCVDCENQFCADCAELLTPKNSGIGFDRCDPCEDKAEADMADSP